MAMSYRIFDFNVTRFVILLLAVAWLASAACRTRSQEMDNYLESDALYAPEPPAPPPPPPPLARMSAAEVGPPSAALQEPTSLDDRKLIKTVDLQLEVESPKDAAQLIQDIIASRQGNVYSISSQNTGQAMHYHLTLRVPVETLDAALAEIRKVAVRITDEHMQTRDVTSQFVDLEARLKTLLGTETELQALLAESRTRRYKVEDIMEIYQELTRIRERIESTQGELLMLERLAAYSTINVKLRPAETAKPLITEEWSATETIHRSVRILMEASRGLADWLIMGTILGIPAVGLFLLTVWGTLRLWRLSRHLRQSE